MSVFAFASWVQMFAARNDIWLIEKFHPSGVGKPKNDHKTVVLCTVLLMFAEYCI